MTPLADIPAWAQVAIALAVPVNTLIGVLGVIAARRSVTLKRVAHRDSRRIRDLEQDLCRERDERCRALEEMANGKDYPEHLL